jgi:hypothetical protein
MPSMATLASPQLGDQISEMLGVAGLAAYAVRAVAGADFLQGVT